MQEPEQTHLLSEACSQKVKRQLTTNGVVFIEGATFLKVLSSRRL